jgi:hypothetical protein
MRFSDFFDITPAIVLRDPLAEFLGTAEGGLIEYRYADAVKLAGHSCPTVAGAWLMTRRALAALYPDAMPERGAVAVAFREGAADGVTGVMAAVAGLITGAASEGGFKGIAGRFVRRGLLTFGAPIAAQARYTRTDSGTAVEVSLQLTGVPASPELAPLLQRCAAGVASAAERQAFATLWQARVRRILVDHHDDPQLVILRAP